ncbi:uroporphyrinogen-III synthase [Peribacillus sp. SCS-37]|uniref:uroporphyrinogen-III synthase n=1 Tax=Paraperibacillus esterisolvens TaxID=3115296 RepID=UPI003906AAF0
MGKGLMGKKVGLGGSRKLEEMGSLIEKQGGMPVRRPLQGTLFLAGDELGPPLQELIQSGSDWFIFTTGIGLESLVEISDGLELKGKFLQRLQESNLAARGYKTISALKKIGIKPVVTDKDGTTRSLMDALDGFDLAGKKITIQLHGEKAPRLMDFLQEKGAETSSILPYRHVLPDAELLERTAEELLTGELDAFCFTTAVQVRVLFEFARERDIHGELVKAFQTARVTAAAVGKVTAEALRDEGVGKLFVPEHERMGAMIMGLGQYFLKAEGIQDESKG